MDYRAQIVVAVATFLSQKSADGFDQQTDYEPNDASRNRGENAGLRDCEPDGRWMDR